MQSNSEVSFLKSLFDFQLRHFITLSVLRFLYALLTILTVLGGAIFMLFGMFSGTRVALLYLIFTPLVVLLNLIFTRLYIELLANLQRIGDNTQKMLDQSSSN
jgi:hypothetical protein